MTFSYMQVPTLSRSMDFRGAQSTSKAEALQKSVYLLLLSWNALTPLGQGRKHFQTNSRESPLSPFYITAKSRLSDLLSVACKFLLLSGILQSTFMQFSVPLCHLPSFNWYLGMRNQRVLKHIFLLFSDKDQYTPPFTGFHISQYTVTLRNIERQTSSWSSAMLF